MNKADPFGDMEAASDLTSADKPEHEQSALQSEEPVQADNVGALLCATRMRKAGDLQAIAKILRIRYSYLVAIEDGRYEDLPGSAYSVGFVRAYADYLGLDGNEVVKRLREETNGTVTNTRFEFPLPSGESGLPNGGLLAIAVAMGAIVYGAWYTMTNTDRDAVDLIQEMPSRIAVLIEDDVKQSVPESVDSEQVTSPDQVIDSVLPVVEQQTQEPDNVTEVAQAPAETETTRAEDFSESNSLPVDTELSGSESKEQADRASAEEDSEDGASMASDDTEVGVEASVEVDSLVADVVASESIDPSDVPQGRGSLDVSEVEALVVENVIEPTVDTPAETVVPKRVEETEAAVASSELSVVESEPRTDEVAAEAQDTSSSEAEPEQVASLPVEPEPVSPLESEPTENAINLSDDAKQVIELRAKSDSWIQVRDGNELLLTRLLREGEVYQVPDRSGLTLMTGNAGGLEVFVGGELMPALGDEGVVKRGVPLSPERLRTGTTPG